MPEIFPNNSSLANVLKSLLTTFPRSSNSVKITSIHNEDANFSRLLEQKAPSGATELNSSALGGSWLSSRVVSGFVGIPEP